MVRRIAKWLTAAFTIALAIMVVGNIYTFIASKVYNDPSPAFFGWSHAVVISGSMEPEISVDDMVVYHAQKGYEVGDFIVFHSGNSLITHRIIKRLPEGW